MMDLLYQSTVYFEVQKFVQNTKSGELYNDKVIEVARIHEKVYQENKIQSHVGQGEPTKSS